MVQFLASSAALAALMALSGGSVLIYRSGRVVKSNVTFGVATATEPYSGQWVL